MIPLLRRYLRPYAGPVALVVVLLFVQSIANLLLPNLNADIINNGIAKDDTEYIVRVGAVMLGVTLVLGIVSIVVVYWSARVAMGFGRDVRTAIFRAVEGFSQVEVNHFGPASLITRNTNDVQQVQMLVFMGLTLMVSAPIMVVGGVIMAIREDGPLSALLLIILPLMIAVIGLVMVRAIPLFRALQAKLDRINQVMRETLAGVRVIRAFVRTAHEEERFDAVNQDLFETGLARQPPVRADPPDADGHRQPLDRGRHVVRGHPGRQRRHAHRQPDRLHPVPGADPLLGPRRRDDVRLRAARSRLLRAHPGGPRDRALHPRPRAARSSWRRRGCVA